MEGLRRTSRRVSNSRRLRAPFSSGWAALGSARSSIFRKMRAFPAKEKPCRVRLPSTWAKWKGVRVGANSSAAASSGGQAARAARRRRTPACSARKPVPAASARSSQSNAARTRVAGVCGPFAARGMQHVAPAASSRRSREGVIADQQDAARFHRPRDTGERGLAALFPQGGKTAVEHREVERRQGVVGQIGDLAGKPEEDIGKSGFFGQDATPCAVPQGEETAPPDWPPPKAAAPTPSPQEKSAQANSPSDGAAESRWSPRRRSDHAGACSRQRAAAENSSSADIAGWRLTRSPLVRNPGPDAPGPESSHRKTAQTAVSSHLTSCGLGQRADLGGDHLTVLKTASGWGCRAHPGGSGWRGCRRC